MTSNGAISSSFLRIFDNQQIPRMTRVAIAPSPMSQLGSREPLERSESSVLERGMRGGGWSTRMRGEQRKFEAYSAASVSGWSIQYAGPIKPNVGRAETIRRSRRGWRRENVSRNRSVVNAQLCRGSSNAEDSLLREEDNFQIVRAC